MALEFNSYQPIYLQLLDYFREQIANGTWAPGSRIESVRNLALEFSVNPNTVQRALAELEREGIAYTERTSGRFITEDKKLIRTIRQNILRTEAENFVKRAKSLHLDKDELEQLLEAVWDRPEAVLQKDEEIR